MASQKIGGVIKVVSSDITWELDRGVSRYYCELTIFTDTGELLPLRYGFPSGALAAAVRDSLGVGAYVEASLDQVANHFEIRSLHIIPSAADSRPDPFGFRHYADPSVEFTPAQRTAFRAALQQAKADIRERFRPTNEQMKRVEERLDELASKVDRMPNFDWTKLFVTAVIGASVDLGFGTTVPEALFNLFKNLVAGVLEQRVLK